MKNYPRLYNQLNPCSRALQSVKTLRTRRTRTCGPGAPNPGRGPGAGAGAGAFKLLPNASNRMPLDIEILPKGLNVHSTLLFASYSAVIILMHLILSKLDALIRLNWMYQLLLTLMHRKNRHTMDLIFMNSDCFVCWS